MESNNIGDREAGTMRARLFLVAASYPNYGRTVAEPVDLSAFDPPPDIPRDLVTDGGVRVWGTRKGGNNREQYEALEPDDLLLFSHDDAFVGAGRVGVKFNSPWISRTFWGYAPAELLYSVEDYRPLDCPCERVNEALGYDRDHRPEGLRQVSDDAARAVADEYGSLEGFVDALAGNE